MSNETRDSGHEVPSCTQSNAHFIWALSKSPAPDEMNTSFGPRIDADRWDFHDGSGKRGRESFLNNGNRYGKDSTWL